MKIENAIKSIREGVLTGKIGEREAAYFFELVCDALSDSLVNVAARYSLDDDIAQAANMILLTGVKH